MARELAPRLVLARAQLLEPVPVRRLARAPEQPRVRAPEQRRAPVLVRRSAKDRAPGLVQARGRARDLARARDWGPVQHRAKVPVPEPDRARDRDWVQGWD